MRLNVAELIAAELIAAELIAAELMPVGVRERKWWQTSTLSGPISALSIL